MGWRYQPVVRVSEIAGEVDFAVSLVEIHLDDEDRLVAWTEEMACAPVGNDVEDLCGEIAHMWMSAMCWKPVTAGQLEVGMTFERTVDQRTRNDLAEFLERGGSLLKSQAI